MKKLTIYFLFIVYLCTINISFSKDYHGIKFPFNERPLKIYEHKKEIILVSEKAFYVSENNVFKRTWLCSSTINSTIENDTCFWVATTQGLITLDKKTYNSSFVDIPALIKRPSVTSVLLDAFNNIWVACEAYGVFTWEGKTLKHKYAVFPVVSAAYTPDSSLWVGTMSGLNRFHGREYIRYNEEGVSNHEIPGNVIDRLILDNVGHLWVFTSEGICVFGLKVEEGHGHLPSIKYLGSPDNNVSGVVYLHKTGYLFTSSAGTMFLPENERETLNAIEEGNTDKVENKALLYNVKIEGRTDFDMIQQVGNYYWIGNKEVVYKFTTKELKNIIALSKNI